MVTLPRTTPTSCLSMEMADTSTSSESRQFSLLVVAEA